KMRSPICAESIRCFLAASRDPPRWSASQEACQCHSGRATCDSLLELQSQMQPLASALAEYVSETRHLDGQPTSTEPTFYPAIKALISAVLKEGRLPFEVRVNTSEAKGKTRDMPDFVLGDDKLFVGVFGEVKRADESLEDIAVSTERNEQIGR